MFRYGRPFLFSSSPSIIIPFQSLLPSQVHPPLQFLVIISFLPPFILLFSLCLFLSLLFFYFYLAFFSSSLLHLLPPPPLIAFYIHPFYSLPPPRVFFLVLIPYSGWTDIHHRVIRRRSILSSPIYSLPPIFTLFISLSLSSHFSS